MPTATGKVTNRTPEEAAAAAAAKKAEKARVAAQPKAPAACLVCSVATNGENFCPDCGAGPWCNASHGRKAARTHCKPDPVPPAVPEKPPTIADAINALVPHNRGGRVNRTTHDATIHLPKNGMFLPLSTMKLLAEYFGTDQITLYTGDQGMTVAYVTPSNSEDPTILVSNIPDDWFVRNAGLLPAES